MYKLVTLTKDNSFLGCRGVVSVLLPLIKKQYGVAHRMKYLFWFHLHRLGLSYTPDCPCDTGSHTQSTSCRPAPSTRTSGPSCGRTGPLLLTSSGATDNNWRSQTFIICSFGKAFLYVLHDSNLSKCCYAMNIVWGFSIITISFLHNNIHLLEAEKIPLSHRMSAYLLYLWVNSFKFKLKVGLGMDVA